MLRLTILINTDRYHQVSTCVENNSLNGSNVITLPGLAVLIREIPLTNHLEVS